jgi:hypothetical protein
MQDFRTERIELKHPAGKLEWKYWTLMWTKPQDLARVVSMQVVEQVDQQHIHLAI